eukprot:CAMPEP_0170339250 /NCGR_PEP_ID=MMETSP0116_2-20130129/70681_1 /TAXON_ID=400756 /ORGANISM="Durinskia baltica, Strain CSIRO CS-38" /LENGTH=69 /DNA_ID=CAMNT_0010592665 /DNA_START=27 /DNA_END=233 /DNA_ORIENTATION=-
MADHLADAQVSDQAFVRCISAAAEALQLVRGRYDSRGDQSSYDALYLRKEATRCIVALCAARPALGKWL